MIEEIQIRNLGVIEASTLPLASGFNVITGETGAGKTMVVTALGLLLGARSDASRVRSGASEARVEGCFAVPPESAAAAVDLGGDVEDGTLLVARQLAAAGRSRAWVGGASVPVSALQSVTAPLVAVHGQSDQRRLLQANEQRDALDRYIGEPATELRARCAEAVTAMRAAQARLAELSENARDRARQADALRFGLDEIAAVAPQVGEDTDLLAEEGRLAHADTLRGATESSRAALSSDTDGADVLSSLAQIRKQLEDVSEHDPQIAEFATRAAEIGYLASDLAADLASYAAGVETDPARLQAVGERRAQLAGLTRKYGDSIAEVLSWGKAAARDLADLEGADDELAGLAEQVDELRAVAESIAEELSQLRQQAAGPFAESVTAELTQLSMASAQLEVVVEPGEVGLSGKDRVEFRLAANAGADPLPLDKGASGGELSRVMLAIEVVLAGDGKTPTLVFDEVDAGVGGKAAVEVGRRLALLARNAQVLAVTHLPQVAAFADHHVVVRKQDDGSVTTTDLEVLDEAARVLELSRMLAGLESSDTAMAHARELMEVAASARTTGESG